MPARELKEPCKNCRQRCTERITAEQRKEIFDDYWGANRDWNYRRMYCIEHVVPQPIQRRRSKVDLDKTSRRLSFHYYLTVNGEMEKVCKKFFLNTLVVGDKFVIVSLHKKTMEGTVMPDRRGRHPAANKIPFTMKQEARRHIQARIVDISGPQEQINLTKMYDDYANECTMQGKESVKKHFYRKMMNEELRINQQRPDGPDADRSEERPLDYTPTPQVSALECLIKELRQREEERIKKADSRVKMKEKVREYHTLRYAGKEYVNFRGQVRPSRKMKPPCDGCQKACTEHISEPQREQLFDNFWDASKDWNEKKRYVVNCIQSRPAANSRARNRPSKTGAKRNKSLRFTYFFEVDGEKVQVCRQFFINTLGLSNNFVSSCVSKQNENGEFDPMRRIKYGALVKLPPALAKEIRQHIIYKCWADPNKSRDYQTHTQTKGWSWNVSKMYDSYRKDCWLRGTKPASTYMYRRVFTEEMKIFHQNETVAPSIPSSSTRSTGKKPSQAKATTDEPRETQSNEEAQESTAAGSPAVLSDANDNESDVDMAEESPDEEYEPSSDGDDDDSDEDEDYEPPNKREKTFMTPKPGTTTTMPSTVPTAPTQDSVQDDPSQQAPAMSSAKAGNGRRTKQWDTADMRCAGQTYVNDKGNVIPARAMKEPCPNCRKQCMERVGQEMREKIFNMFWSKEMTWEKKRQYMEDCVEEVAVKTRTVPVTEMKLNRKVHMKYTLKLGDWEQNVCKLFFLNTLGISQKFVIVSLKKQKERDAQSEDSSSDSSEPSVPFSPATMEDNDVPMPQGATPDGSGLRDVLSHLLLIPTTSSM